MALQGNKKSFIERLTGTVRVDDERPFRERVETEDAPRYREQYQDEPRVNRVSAQEDVAQEHEDDTYDEDAQEDVDEDTSGTLAIDMYESDSELVIQSMIAGVTPEYLNISITRDTVTIRGRRVAPNGIPDDAFVFRELYWGEFARVIELPCEIDTDNAEAVEKYGLLIIRLPKLHIKRSQELKVKSI